MGTVAITWLKNEPNTGVAVGTKQNSVGTTPPDYTDSFFEVVTSTSATSKDSGAAPAECTLAQVAGVSGAHYIRNDKDSTAPTTTTGGIYLGGGGVTFIPVAAGDKLKICTVS